MKSFAVKYTGLFLVLALLFAGVSTRTMAQTGESYVSLGTGILLIKSRHVTNDALGQPLVAEKDRPLQFWGAYGVRSFFEISDGEKLPVRFEVEGTYAEADQKGPDVYLIANPSVTGETSLETSLLSVTGNVIVEREFSSGLHAGIGLGLGLTKWDYDAYLLSERVLTDDGTDVHVNSILEVGVDITESTRLAMRHSLFHVTGVDYPSIHSVRIGLQFDL